MPANQYEGVRKFAHNFAYPNFDSDSSDEEPWEIEFRNNTPDCPIDEIIDIRASEQVLNEQSVDLNNLDPEVPEVWQPSSLKHTVSMKASNLLEQQMTNMSVRLGRVTLGTTCGLVQGGSSCPMQFCTFMYMLCQIVQERVRNQGSLSVESRQYVDDAVFSVDSPLAAARILYAVNEIFPRFGLMLGHGVDKDGILYSQKWRETFGPQFEQALNRMTDKAIVKECKLTKVVPKFKYLGVDLSYTQDPVGDQNRVLKAQLYKLTHPSKTKYLIQNTQISQMFYTSMVIPRISGLLQAVQHQDQDSISVARELSVHFGGNQAIQTIVKQGRKQGFHLDFSLTVLADQLISLLNRIKKQELTPQNLARPEFQKFPLMPELTRLRHQAWVTTWWRILGRQRDIDDVLKYIDNKGLYVDLFEPADRLTMYYLNPNTPEDLQQELEIFKRKAVGIGDMPIDLKRVSGGVDEADVNQIRKLNAKVILDLGWYERSMRVEDIQRRDWQDQVFRWSDQNGRDLGFVKTQDQAYRE